MEKVEFFTASNGQASARLGNVNLYSSYNPEKEAERFAAEALGTEVPPVVVILGAGLGYLERAIIGISPAAEIISICFDREIREKSPARGNPVWAPGDARSLSRFLEETLQDTEPEEVKIIEWPAAVRAYPEEHENARRELIRVLKENAYGALTAAWSGRQWLKNSLVNFLTIERPVTGNPLRPGLPTVIAASGPSLEKALPLLAVHRDKLNLWALPSSVLALEQAGLVPDCVVATDAGYYASVLLNAGREKIPLLAMPLSAARGAWRTAEKVLFLLQPNFFEEELFARAGVEAARVIAHGTVAGSALDLARRFSAVPVVFAGLDFCHDDIRAHVTPHPFNDLDARASTRFSPLYSELFGRALEAVPERWPGTRFRSSGPLALYAASFASLGESGGEPVYRLFPSAREVPGMENIDKTGFTRLLAAAERGTMQPELLPVKQYPDAARRSKIVRELVENWSRACREGKKALVTGKNGLNIMKEKPLALLVDFLGGPGGRALKKALRKPEKGAGERAAALLDEITRFLELTLQKLAYRGRNA